ncbi:hypothetical protein NIES2135_67680 (plasmid) [Leptolyngbya boryana NIES-2135]|jgi:hypothetical protein|uniref:Uncharacterized protein n=1 Tax=Leptolyngbya boryana NIES-2135 TaxID=1973484 RepID=A0A1Z4JT14_LEPBY|nr:MULTISPECIES: hypothetical protein [Leptolyngbya]BAS60130.1 hypothetical protein LBWT_X2020 [Leptolyngbya boryana IAM M-101]BAS66478.1 hypothetical protein LBDG_X2020 [Leptolyngbya boryana dg5]BAY59891.1 hypothetical protein NIES2135_67680 [Leptolyngbya boryana NIES-2135]
MISLNELPGAELILSGLDDLQNGKSNTVGSLLVAIAATRLAEAGLDIPKERLAVEPELTLYAHLQNEREDAYLYYNALLHRLTSFCNAIELYYQNDLISTAVPQIPNS